MNTQVCQQTTKGSLSGEIKFPTVIQMLMENGIESYHVDLMRKEKTFYTANGESFVEPFECSISDISTSFNANDVISAIRDSQNSKIIYTEFLDRIALAGSNYYIVYISGKRAVYFGRNGDFHIEHFPKN